MSQYQALIQLSGLDGTNGFRMLGSFNNDLIGYLVSSAGDFNHDGIGDLIVGGYGPTSGVNAGPGVAYVVYGSATGFAASFELATMTAAQGVAFAGVGVGDLAGWSGGGLGDINGDGVDDIGIGALQADPDGVDGAGAAYVVFGGQTGVAPSLASLDGANGFRIDGLAGASTPYSLHSAGDLNADGLDDLVLTSLGENGGDGAAYVVYGRSDGFAASLDVSQIDGANGFRIGGSLGEGMGVSASGLGDVNGDGIDDLIVGAFLADGGGRFNAGQSYVIFGSAAGFAADFDVNTLDGSNGFWIKGAATSDSSGFSAATVGDFNGDGLADIALGAPLADPNGQSSGAGYVIYGTATGFPASFDLANLSASDGFRLSGLNPGDTLARTIAAAGDLNADGFDDLIVTAAQAAGAAGLSYVVFGAATGFGTDFDLASLDGDNGFVLAGSGHENSGSSAAAAGDVNGDGIDDLIVGAIDSGGIGTSYVLFGVLPDQAVTRFGSLAGQTIQGGDFDDALHGLGGGDRLVGHGGGDLLDGGTGADTLDGGLGADTLSGAGGLDTASYADAASSVRVDLSIAAAQNTFGAGTDTLVSIENLTGSAFADILTGDAKANLLDGGDGKDRLLGGGGADVLGGGAGADKLTGGAGADVMTGGSGKDIFVFLDLGDSARKHADLITDLAAGDRIDLHAIDANSTVAGNQAFHLVGALSGHAGEAALKFSASSDTTSLSLDVDGDGKADMVVVMAGDQHAFAGFIL